MPYLNPQHRNDAPRRPRAVMQWELLEGSVACLPTVFRTLL